MAVTPPPVKKRFIPFQLDELSGQYDAETINRNFRRITDGFGVFAQKMQTAYVSLPTSSTALSGPPQVFVIGPEICSDDSGTEYVLDQWRIKSGDPGQAIVIGLSGDFLSATGTSTFRLRMGGGNRTPDGTVVVSKTQAATGTSYSPDLVTAGISSPGGLQRLKLTVQSSGSGVVAAVKDGYASVGAS